MPTPATDYAGGTVERYLERKPSADGKRTAVTDLRLVVENLLPTPTTGTGRNETSAREADSRHHSGTTLFDVHETDRWGRYADAIKRHELLVTHRPAPEPSVFDVNSRRGRVLNPVFVEWMQGLPEGHVTGLQPPEMARSHLLRILGNGVVPQQAEAAFAQLIERHLAAHG